MFKKFIIKMTISLLILGSTANMAVGQNLPRTTTSQVHPEKYANLSIFDTKKNKEYNIIGGHNFGTGKAALTLNGQDVSSILSHPKDFFGSESSCTEIDLYGDILAVSARVNATSNLGLNTDVQVRSVLYNLESKEELQSFTFRNLGSGTSTADQVLYQNKYLYILMKDITNSSKIETEYSGYPSQPGGIELTGVGSSLIQINLEDNSIREKYWPTGTELGGKSMAFDEEGNIYFITLDNAFSSTINVHGYNQELEEIFFKSIERDPEANFQNNQPIGIYESKATKVLALTDGRLPVTIDLYSGEVHYSKNQEVEGNTSKVINDINDMGEIQVLSNGYFILSTKDLELEFGNGWFIVFDTEAQRKLYFREHLELPEENSIARPYIVSYYVDKENNSINYTAAIYQDGVVKLNDVVLADGSQDPSEVILFSGTISGTEIAEFANRGVKDLSAEEGDLEFDFESNTYTLSGNNNLNSVDLTAEPYPGYLIFPKEEVSIDLSGGKKFFFSALDTEENGDGRFSNFYIIYEVIAPKRLSTSNIKKEKFRVYPNPTTSVLNFKVDMTDKQVIIYNLLGKQVMKHSFITENSPLDVSALSKGMYLLAIIQDGVIVGKEKIIKN